MGDYDLVTARKYYVNGLLIRKNSRGSSGPTRIRYAKTKVEIEKVLQVGISYALRDSYYFMSVMQLMFLMLIPKN